MQKPVSFFFGGGLEGVRCSFKEQSNEWQNKRQERESRFGGSREAGLTVFFWSREQPMRREMALTLGQMGFDHRVWVLFSSMKEPVIRF